MAQKLFTVVYTTDSSVKQGSYIFMKDEGDGEDVGLRMFNMVKKQRHKLFSIFKKYLIDLSD